MLLAGVMLTEESATPAVVRSMQSNEIRRLRVGGPLCVCVCLQVCVYVCVYKCVCLQVSVCVCLCAIRGAQFGCGRVCEPCPWMAGCKD